MKLPNRAVNEVLFVLIIMTTLVSSTVENRDTQSLAERAWPRARNFIAGMASGVGLVLAGGSRESFIGVPSFELN
jgi:hypothetical protein